MTRNIHGHDSLYGFPASVLIECMYPDMPETTFEEYQDHVDIVLKNNLKYKKDISPEEQEYLLNTRFNNSDLLDSTPDISSEVRSFLI